MHDLEFDSLAWCEIDGILIFLDIERDRYFRLPEGRNSEILCELDASGRGRTAQPKAWPKPTNWEAPYRQSHHVSSGPFRLVDVAGSIWLQRRIERRLSANSFVSVLTDFHHVTARHELAPSTFDRAGARVVRAFEHAKLLRSAADRCLPRSIALALGLAARGWRSNVVLGVKLSPFAAHCWAQAGDEVLNDSAEEVQRYTPILVL